MRSALDRRQCQMAGGRILELDSAFTRSIDAWRIGPVTRPTDTLEDKEWRRLILLEEEVTGKWVNVIETEAAADRILSVLKRIPCEAKTRLKVAKRGILVIRANAA